MINKSAVKYFVSAVLILWIVLSFFYMYSLRALTLLANGTVPVYATEDDALKTPSPTAIALLLAGQSVPVTKCLDVKHYLIYKVQLADGRDGFVLDGKYTLMRDGKQAFCS